MTEVTINWLAILYAVIASMVIGMIWYGVFATPWMKAIGKKKEDLQGGQTTGYVISIITAALMAYVLTHWVTYMGVAFPDMTGATLGASTAFWGWLGFVAPLSAMNTAWEGRSWNLWLINNGNHLVTLVVMGMIIAVMM